MAIRGGLPIGAREIGKRRGQSRPRDGAPIEHPRSVPRPGPRQNEPVPAVLPAGVLPDEKSAMWLFTTPAFQKGEDLIQDDTRLWLNAKGGEVEVKREYFDHPRWSAEQTRRALFVNRNIVAEVHMLVRLRHDRSAIPDWAWQRAQMRSAQAESGFQLLRVMRRVFGRKAEQIVNDVADRQPAVFMKLMASMTVPRQTEVTQVEDPLARVSDDALKRMIDEVDAKLAGQLDALEDANHAPLDYRPEVELIEEQKIDAIVERAGEVLKAQARTPVREVEPIDPTGGRWDD